MNARGHPDRILELRLGGRFAHFRKFYTNASSLSFTLPPRTALTGMFASILLIPRDSYYEKLSSQELFLAVSLEFDSQPRKFMQTMNYMPGNSASDLINDASKHKQCRFELLTGQGNGGIFYRIWLGYHSSNELLASLEEKIRAQNFGFGIYLGQRQFPGHLILSESYESHQFKHLPAAQYVDSAIALSKAKPALEEMGSLQIERMPLEQKIEEGKKKASRRLARIDEILFHAKGLRIHGEFSDCYMLDSVTQDVISFL